MFILIHVKGEFCSSILGAYDLGKISINNETKMGAEFN
jgi:hypothetical protein